MFDPARLREIAVEHDIGGGRKAALEQVHQQEGKVVEDVARPDDVAELDGIEKKRPAVNQDDIAEVKVTMDAADETLPPAFSQKGNDTLVSVAACAREFIAG